MFRIDEDGCEFVTVVPGMWEYEQDEDEVIIIGDDDEEGARKSQRQFLKERTLKGNTLYTIKGNGNHKNNS